jgi:hypothetical protein
MDKRCQDASARSENPFLQSGFWAAAFFGAVLSMLITGYVFPNMNNVFHVPIVAELYKEPEFASDLFIQSLKYFSSGLWLVLAGSVQWIEPVRLFFLLLLLSRLLSFIGFLACADHFGVREPRQRFLFAALISVTSLMQTPSFAGDGGLFLNYFTHSEIANGIFLLAVYAVLRGRFTFALCSVGVTFFVNAFFGVWLAFVMMFVVGNEIVSSRFSWQRFASSVGIATFVNVLFALPILINIVSNPDFGKPIGFDYVIFLEYYFPDHFLFYATSISARLGLAALLAVCVLALAVVRDRDRRLTTIVVACACLYVVGIFIPNVTHSPLVLNLHLLRSSTTIHLLAALLVCTVVVRWWFGHDRKRAALAACAMSVMSVYPVGFVRYLIPAALVAILMFDRYETFMPGRQRLADFLISNSSALRKSALAVSVVAACFSTFVNQYKIARIDGWRSEWERVAEWARRETVEGAIFLVPVVKFTEEYPGREEEIFGLKMNTTFEMFSHRSLWVDFKRGAAVMWRPSYYVAWRTRVDEVVGLESFEERNEYARIHGISYIIEITKKDCRSNSVFRTDRICVSAIV